MTLDKLIAELIERGVQLGITDSGQLAIRAPKGTITPTLHDQLREAKEPLLQLLQHTHSHGNLSLYPATAGQQALWFIHQVAPQSPAYNVVLALRVHTAIDTAALRHACQQLCLRYVVLRTTFRVFAGKPVQVVTDRPEFVFTQVVTRSWDERQIEEQIHQLAQRPFNLEQGPLFRIHLLTHANEQHVLLLTMHHSISDLWSLGLLLKDLLALYATTDAKVPDLEPVTTTYADYTRWHTEQLHGVEGERLRNYWHTQLAGPLSVLNLMPDFPRPAVKTYHGAAFPFQLDAALTGQLRALARAQKATLYTTLLAVFHILLTRYTGQADILIGTPVSGRTQPDFQDVVGYLANMLVLRTPLQADDSFHTYLQRVQHTVTQALSNQDYPFAMLVESLQPHRDPSRNPIFDVAFALESARVAQEDVAALLFDTNNRVFTFGNLALSAMPMVQQEGQFDLMLHLFDQDSVVTGAFLYHTDLFTTATIERMAAHLQTLLSNLLANPEQRISDLSLLTAAEEAELVTTWNQTEAPFPDNQCLHHMFEVQAARTPEATAVITSAGERLSYRELNQRANQLAHYLQAHGVMPGMCVGIYLERTADLLVALLGTLKAGGTYLPLDPIFPQERLAFILADAQAAILLTQSSLQNRAPLTMATAVYLDTIQAELAAYATGNLKTAVSPRHIAYLIYTSGSTGRPKGVQIRHEAVVNLLHAFQTTPGLTSADIVMAVTTISFDIAVIEIFLPLSVGAQIILVGAEIAADGKQLQTWIERSGVTMIQATPATYRLLLDTGWQGVPQAKVLVGGEAFPTDLAKQLLTQCASLWNVYGPTETTVWATVYPVTKETLSSQSAEGAVSIGRPISNTQVYVLDAALRPVPTGVPGELCIGGKGLSDGYWQRPRLTAERFVPNPFANGTSSSVLYRTGDLVRYFPDGNLQFLGRIDSQVKIRGFRVELGEIEAILLQHPQIHETAVVMHEGTPGDQRLIAYYVTQHDEPPDTSQIRHFLQDKLPHYMIPALFIQLEILPLTANGKIDRRALPAPTNARPQLGQDFVAPRSALEEELAALLAEVLGLDRVGLRDNFFELGGHSLLLAQFHQRLQTELHYQIPITDLFRHPTLESLAASLDANQSDTTRHLQERVYGRIQQRRQTAVELEEQIAIIGMAGRFPGANDLQAFWQNLRDGRDTITFFTDTELLAAGVSPDMLSRSNFVPAGSVLEDIDTFDARFFGFTPREAELMDPQQRIFLECAWHALEDAGYDPFRIQHPVGVYAGSSNNGYMLNNLRPHLNLSDTMNSFQFMISNGKDYLPTRVAYHLNLKGPAINVQTACSTSLVAVVLACRSLKERECDTALAGGVTVLVPHRTGYVYQSGGIFSEDGHCRSFDAAGRGTVFGSGVGIVVLKRLADALTDGDQIYAVIKGAAVNNDGAQKVGYTAPSPDGQAEVIALAQELSGIDPQTITYVEAHGTATELGDPIEVAALTQAFRRHGRSLPTQYCALGSVKSNVGHLDAAAGVAGLIKTTLALHHREIPPSLHFTQPNPRINFADTPFYVNTTLAPWNSMEGVPCRAGVSSFGIGGTNAHVVLEEASTPLQKRPSRPQQLLLLSARTAAALETATENLAAFLQNNADVDLADVAYTLQVGRASFDHRRMIICGHPQEAAQILREADPRRVLTASAPQHRTLVFMFPGGGTQYVNMARELYQTESIFQAEIDRCADLLQAEAVDLLHYLYPDASSADEMDKYMQRPSIALPCLFAVEYALARLWMAWGISPQAMIGHSLGEYTAACLADVLTLTDALALVTLRGRLFDQLPPGGMISVAAAADTVSSLLDDQLSIAAINAPDLCVISGSLPALAECKVRLAQHNLSFRELKIDVAAHSNMVEDILAAFTDFVQTLSFQPPQIPYISNVTGTWITDEQATDPLYWVRHLRQTVRFAEGITVLQKDANTIFLEVGPGRTLSTLVRKQIPPQSTHKIYTSVRHPQDTGSDAVFLLTALGRLWLAGTSINWSGFYTVEERRRLSLPLYPFARDRFWIDTIPVQPQPETETTHKLPITSWFYIPEWKQTVQPTAAIPTTVQNWLLFTDEGGTGKTLAQTLRDMGHTVTLVQQGEAFQHGGGQQYVIRAAVAADYAQLLDSLPTPPDHIVHLWSVTSSGTTIPIKAWQEVGFYSLLYLAQAIGKHAHHDKPLNLAVITTQAQRVWGNENVIPEKATLLGPCRVIPQEYPSIRCKYVDILFPETANAQHNLVQQLAADLAAHDENETVLAYRGRSRWTQTFTPVSLPMTAPTNIWWQPDGVYLITGGLGGIGLVLGHYLAKNLHPKLILWTRSNFPPSEDWAHWQQTHGDADPTSRKINQLQQMVAQGAEVLVQQVDVTDLLQVETAVTVLQQRFGRIHVVLHAAGVPTGGVIQLKDKDRIEATFAPKIQGTRNLLSALAAEPPKGMILFSTINAVVGGFGQVDHAAANAYLDALAQQAAHSWQTPYLLSINWPAWQEVGQAANTTVPSQLDRLRRESLQRGISPQEGTAVFEHLLAHTLPQVIVSPQPLAAVIAQANNPQALLPKLAATPVSENGRDSLETPYVAPRNETELQIAAIWQELLGIRPVGIYDNFFELGGNSLIAIQIMTRLQEAFQMQMPPSRLFELQTVADIALAVVQEQAQQSDATLLEQLLSELEQEPG